MRSGVGMIPVLATLASRGSPIVTRSSEGQNSAVASDSPHSSSPAQRPQPSPLRSPKREDERGLSPTPHPQPSPTVSLHFPRENLPGHQAHSPAKRLQPTTPFPPPPHPSHIFFSPKYHCSHVLGNKWEKNSLGERKKMEKS